MAYTEYLTKYKTKRTEVNVFLSGKNTMLTGKISDFDDTCIILDECLIFRINIISITPQKKS